MGQGRTATSRRVQSFRCSSQAGRSPEPSASTCSNPVAMRIELGLAPRRADEAETDRQRAGLADRDADRRVAGDCGRLVAGRDVRVAVDMVDAPSRANGRNGEHVGFRALEGCIDPLAASSLPVADAGLEVSGIVESADGARGDKDVLAEEPELFCRVVLIEGDELREVRGWPSTDGLVAR